MERFSQLKDLCSDVLLLCPECSDTVAFHSLSHVLSDFLRVSKAWHSVFLGDLVAGQDYVELKEFPSALLEQVLVASIEGCVVSRGQIAASSDGVISLCESLVPTESVADGFECSCALVTNVHADNIPSWLVNEVAHILIPGAVSRLMLMPRVPYSNPELGAFYMQEYNGLVTGYLGKISQRRVGVKRGFGA